ncbi:MAG: ABC transporter substrate-binding protein, partial [Gammaproteobacteria bacterium]|nr:ABC transporter substrate-binding protein [Gammaproteobacteria bacterium]
FLFRPVDLFAQPLEKVAIQFHWLEQFEFAGFYIAKEKGFYSDAGLEVTFLPHKIGETDVVTAVESGRAQYGVNYSSLIKDYHRQRSVIALAAILQDSPMVLMSRDDAVIKSAADLKGKRIMIGGDALNAAPINAFMFRNGLVNDDFIKQIHSHDVNDLIEGKTDAITAYISNEPYKMQELEQGYRIFDPKKIGLSFYENILFTTRHEVQNHPDRTKAFVDASLKGWAYAFENIEETARILRQKYNEQGKSYEHLVYEGYELKKLAYKKGANLGELSIEKLKKIDDAYRLMGIELSQKSMDEFIWNEARPIKERRVQFTSEEEMFIQNRLIKAATTTNWAPFAFVDHENGNAAGIGYDFWDEVVKTAGLNTQLTTFDSFLVELNSLKDKTQDVIYSSGITEDRKRYSLFTEPYVSFPISIATSKEENFIQDMELLKGKKIAVGQNFTAHKMMLSAYPDLKYVLVSTIQDGLQMVSKGGAYAYVDIMPTLSHSINQFGFTNLKISGNTGLMFDMRMMIRDDYPELVSIANKVILNLHPDKKQAIINKWINVQYQQKLDLTRYWPHATAILVVVLLLLLWMQRSKRSSEAARMAAEAASRAKSEFLASMSHEIRTPMAGVIGFANMLLDDDLPQESKEKVLSIKSSTNALLRILNDILDMSKLEAGKMEIEHIDFQLRKLILEVVSQTEGARYSKPPIQLNVNFSDDFPSAVNSDPTRIRQILINLIGNALKFTHYGSVNINCELNYDGNGERMIKVSVKDTGIGLSKESIDNIFTNFTQADSSISRKYEGSGLGLAICRRLVDLLKGDIGVESKKDVGSEFWFTFPYIETATDLMSEGEHEKRADNHYKALRCLNILAAEDNGVNQLIIKAIMEKFGHTVTIAEDGKKAVSALENSNFDLILMDVRMPEMDGSDATRIIRQMNGGKSAIPIIAVTADAVADNVASCFEAGMNGYVSKPIEIMKLLTTINEVLGEEIHVPL